MAEERRISPAVAIIPIGLGLGLALAVAAVAWAAPPTPPPEGYPCPYCPMVFDTFEELVAHVQSEHPGERIPIHIIWQ
ncbi:hypothetical protein ES703_126043 [subsurface metagenome]